MSVIPTDIRYAVRRWVARPGLAITVVLTLGLGIGAATAIFSLVDGVLLRPLPWREPERLASVYLVREAWRTDPVLGFSWNTGLVSWPKFRELQQQVQTFEAVAAFQRARPVTVTGTSGVVQAITVSSGFLSLLGAQPYAGRTFTPGEDDAANDSVMVSYEAWQRRFGGAPDIVGRRTAIDDVPKTIVGVLPPRFRYEGEPPEFLLPFGIVPATNRSANNNAYRVVARLGDGVTLTDAERRIAPLLDGGQGRNQNTSRLVSLADDQLGPARSPLFLLMGASGLLLLIACANVAGLLLGDAGARRGEIAIRRALGAGPWRVTRQMLAESALLAVGGGVTGLVAAWWILPVLVALAPTRLPRIDAVQIDARVLVFAAILSGAATVVCGLVPSFAGSATSPVDILRLGRGGARFRNRSQRLIVSGQVALTVVLLVGAALLGETIIRLTSTPVGFDDRNLVVLNVASGRSLLSEPVERRTQIRELLLERIRGYPGVESAAATSSPPFGTSYSSNNIEVGNRPGEPLSAQTYVVSEGFFDTMRLPVLRGRTFERTDAARRPVASPAAGGSPGETGVTIVSREFERRYLGGDASGQRLRVNGVWLDVIGVVADVKSRQYSEDARPAYYLFSGQMASLGAGQLVIRASGDPAALVAALRDAVTAFDSRLTVALADTMQTLMARTVANERYRATLSSAFGGAALLLAAVGLFGLLTRTVNERRREIGVRIAVGAKPGDVVRLVMREGGALVAGGLLVGVPAAFAAAQLIRSQLYGVAPSDPHIFVLVSVVLGTVACGAMLLPAIHASRVDPISTLRAD
jgi:putative ABC transport system permease protein